jgi:hypothetical protein
VNVTYLRLCALDSGQAGNQETDLRPSLIRINASRGRGLESKKFKPQRIFISLLCGFDRIARILLIEVRLFPLIEFGYRMIGIRGEVLFSPN